MWLWASGDRTVHTPCSTEVLWYLLSLPGPEPLPVVRRPWKSGDRCAGSTPRARVLGAGSRWGSRVTAGCQALGFLSALQGLAHL